MYKEELTFRSDNGQLTPVAQDHVVSEAKNFDADVTITANGKTAKLNGIFNLATLGIRNGDLVQLSGKGPDGEKCVSHLSRVLKEL